MTSDEVVERMNYSRVSALMFVSYLIRIFVHYLLFYGTHPVKYPRNLVGRLLG